MVNKNSQEALGVMNAFSYVGIGRLEGLNPKANMKIVNIACDYK